MKYYICGLSTWTIFDVCDSLEEAKQIIKEYEESDKDDGTYTEDFYYIVNENKNSVMLNGDSYGK